MTQLTKNLTVWELYFKAVDQLSWRAFSSAYSPLTVTRQTEISTRVWRVVVSHTVILIQFANQYFVD